MSDDDKKKEDLKEALRLLPMIEANLENWTYAQVNAEYLDPQKVADALEQVLSYMKPMISTMRNILEVEALTTLDAIDLID